MKRARLAVALLLLCSVASCDTKERPAVTLATTTSIEGSGLLPILVREFRRDSDIEVHPLVVGSGRALQLCRQREADVAITHDPELERQFVRSGDAAEYRQFMWNEFVVAGPRSDPAHVRSARTASEAFRRIYDGRAKFCSRGDSSGTHARELAIWQAASIDPARNANYLLTRQPMATLLRTADDAGAYALTDRATFEQLRSALSLEVLLAGDPALRNVYAVTVARGAAEGEAARAFARWITGGKGREVIRRFRIDGKRAFYLPGESAEAKRAD